MVHFDSSLCQNVIRFLCKAKEAQRDVVFCESFRLEKASLFLLRGSNDWGWFVKATE